MQVMLLYYMDHFIGGLALVVATSGSKRIKLRSVTHSSKLSAHFWHRITITSMLKHERLISRIVFYPCAIIPAQMLLSYMQVNKSYENFKNSATKKVDQNEIKMQNFSTYRDFW